MVNSNPPINELVIGVQLDANLIGNAELFTLYERFKSKFTRIEESNTLPTFIIRDDIFNFNNQQLLPGTRKIFVSEKDNALLQLQSNKFWYNWRQSTGTEVYPGYDKIKNEWVSIVNELVEIISNLCSSVNLIELTYVDMIDLTYRGLTNFGTGDLFANIEFSDKTKHLEMFDIQEIIENKAYLYRNINSANRKLDNSNVIRLEMTARGSNKFSNVSDMESNLNDFHDILSKEFYSLLPNL
ncbi:MAG: TIGR04255 family protein [Bacteroidetes bacterium]|nr:TIGR04255 family protein [Bacteroidota bacterium]